jgi:hypothetical protein
MRSTKSDSELSAGLLEMARWLDGLKARTTEEADRLEGLLAGRASETLELRLVSLRFFERELGQRAVELRTAADRLVFRPTAGTVFDRYDDF